MKIRKFKGKDKIFHKIIKPLLGIKKTDTHKPNKLKTKNRIIHMKIAINKKDKNINQHQRQRDQRELTLENNIKN